MSAVIPDLDHWIQIYLSTTSSIESQRDESIQALETQIHDHPVESLQTMIALFECPIENQEHATTVKSQVCLYLSRLLKLEPETLKEIFQTSQTLNSVLQILREQLFSENEAMRDSCADIFSSLFVVFGEELHHFFTEMISPLSSKQTTPFHYGIINMLLALLRHKLFLDIIAPIIQTEFDFILKGCVNILGDPYINDTFIHTCIISATFLSEFISKCPSIFNPPQSAVEKVNFILDAIQNSIVIPNKDLYEALLSKLLLSIINICYPIIPQFMKLINEYARVGLNSNQPQFVSISLLFLGKIAEIEKAIEENHLIFVKKNSRKLEEPFSLLDPPLTDFQLIPIFIEHLSKYIQEDDIAVERPKEAPQPNMFAAISLQLFYKFRPNEVSDQLRQAIESLIAQPKNWIEIHSAILLMNVLLDEPNINFVGQYISQFYNSIINCCMPDQPPRLRETALFLVGLLLNNYPQCIRELPPGDAQQRIEIILQLFEQLSSSITPQMQLTYDDLAILSRCSTVIARLASVYKNNPFNNQLTMYFDRFIAVSRRFFAIGQLNGARDLICHSRQAISQLIIYSSHELKDKLPGLYLEIMTDFENLSHFDIDQSTSFLIKAQYCAIITGFVLRFIDGKQYSFIEQIAPRTLEKLFRLLSSRNDKIYEEALMTISSFIRAASNIECQRIFGPDNMDILLNQFIYDGLTSVSPQIIIAAAFLLGQIYSSKIAPPDYLFHHFERFYGILGQLLFNFDNLTVYPTILRAIGEMFLSPQFSIPNQNPFKMHELMVNGIPINQSLKELLLLATGQLEQLDLANKEDVIYGNKFARYLSLVYGGYAKNFYCTTDLSIERQQLLFLDKLSQMIYRLYPKIDQEVLQQFAKTCKLFGEHCTRKNIVILNRASIHRLLRSAFEFDTVDPMIIKEVREAIDFLKNRG